MVKFSRRDQSKQFLTLPVIDAVEDAESSNISTHSQRIKPIGKTLIVKNPSCPTLDAVKWKKLVTGGSSPEVRAVLHVGPNLRLIKV
ncbi:unnamed protein product, partial [Iphiclides podalirius]